MKKNKFTSQEKYFLKMFELQANEAEKEQYNDLLVNCNNPYQYAKTLTVYKADWEKTKNKMINSINENGYTNSGISKEVMEEMIKFGDGSIRLKLSLLGCMFRRKFNDDLFKYINKDYTTKGCLGIILLILLPFIIFLF